MPSNPGNIAVQMPNYDPLAYSSNAYTVTTSGTQITIPASATTVTIIPQTSSATALALMGISTDTGIPISTTNPTGHISFGSGVTSFYLKTTGASAVVVVTTT